MARALALTEFDYVLKQDQEGPEEERTTWRLRPLTFREHALVARTELRRGKSDDETVMITDTLGSAGRTIQAALIGWTNFRTADGVQIPYGRDADGKLPDATMDLLKPFAMELEDVILEHSQLSKEQQKNSGSR
jgi:hypothetical protein